MPMTVMSSRNFDFGSTFVESKKRVPPRLDLGHVLVPGLGIQRNHHVDAAATAAPARLGDADLIPRGQALNIRWKDVARRNRHAHLQYSLGEKRVGRGRARTVDIRE